eukprot:12105234-Alexandrium_andersonii.AAC.1
MSGGLSQLALPAQCPSAGDCDTARAPAGDGKTVTCNISSGRSGPGQFVPQDQRGQQRMDNSPMSF